MLRGATGMAFSHCDYVHCSVDDISVVYGHSYVSPVLSRESPFDDMLLKWETELSIPVHCFLFDSVFFKERGIEFDEKLQTNEDWDCWMDVLSLHPKVFYVDRVLAYYRIRNSSRCSDMVKMRKGYLAAIDKQMQKHRSNEDVVAKLNTRKKQIKFRYRDHGPLMRLMSNFPPVVKKLYLKSVPWRIQRLLD